MFQQSKLACTQKISKKKIDSFVVPHVSLEKFFKTMVQSRGVRDGDRMSSVS